MKLLKVHVSLFIHPNPNLYCINIFIFECDTDVILNMTGFCSNVPYILIKISIIIKIQVGSDHRLHFLFFGYIRAKN